MDIRNERSFSSSDMTNEPNEPIDHPNDRFVKDLLFTPGKEYSDEFYEAYIASFQKNTKKRYLYRFLKRSFDILASLLALILLSPAFLVIAIAIKIDSQGKVLFRQERIGKNGKPFICYKFRSMVTTAPKNLATADLERPEEYVTRVGAFLRRFSLDELPQLFCCLIGTMSVIGPRPLIPHEEECNDMRMRLGVFAMRPGISGYAQVNGRDDLNYKNKAILDAIYVKNASLWMDIKLLFRTVWVVFSRNGNNSENMEASKKDGKGTQ